MVTDVARSRLSRVQCFHDDETASNAKEREIRTYRHLAKLCSIIDQCSPTQQPADQGK